MIRHLLFQGSPEWHEFRACHIGSSDAPVIMGHGYISLAKLYEVKMGISEVPTTPAMRRGSEMEEAIRKEWNPVAKPAVFTSEKHPWMSASVDGWVDHFFEDIGDESHLCEIKTCGESTWKSAQKEIPTKHWIQCQHILEVTESKFMDYILVNQETLEKMQMRVYRDDAYIERMIAAEKEFYDRLINFDPPETAIKTVEDAELEAILIEIEKEKAIQKASIEREQALRNHAIERCGDESVKCGGFTVRRQVRKGAVDYSAIPELNGVDLDQYRKKETIVWTIKGK